MGRPADRGPGSRLRSLLPSVAILVLIGGLYSYHREATRLSERARSLEARAEARTLRERLLGARIEGLSLEVLRQGEDETGRRPALHVLWFVNPETCLRCLDDLSGWRQLARRPRVDASLVLTGVARPKAVEVMGGALDPTGRVLRDRDGSQLRSLVGNARSPPFLLLAVDRDGRVLAAEVGHWKTACDPDLFRNLSRLVGTVTGPDEFPGDASSDVSLWNAIGTDE